MPIPLNCLLILLSLILHSHYSHLNLSIQLNKSIVYRCEQLGLISRCHQLECREATLDEILTLHTQEHVDILRATENSQDVVALEELSSRYDAIYVHPVSNQSP